MILAGESPEGQINFGRNTAAIGARDLGTDLDLLVQKICLLPNFYFDEGLFDPVEFTKSDKFLDACDNLEEILNFDMSKIIIKSSFDENCGKRTFRAYRIDPELEQELNEQQHMSNSPEPDFDEER